jgi:hypothetical protein
VLTKGKKHLRWIFFEKKKSTHRETTKFCFLVCESKKRVERLNPKRQRQKTFISGRQNKKRKKRKRNQEHQTHTHTHTHTDIQSGTRTKTFFFWFFFKSLQKSRRYARERVEHTHKTFSSIFFPTFFLVFFLIFAFVGFISRDRNYK